MNILICEDEYFIRRALAEHLSALNNQVTELNDGFRCLEWLFHNQPELVLVDDYSVAREIRELYPELHLILMSSENREDFEHILKPYQLSEVSDLIRSRFEGQTGK